MPALFNLHLGWTAHFEQPWSPSPPLSVPPPDLLTAWENEGIRLLACNLSGETAQAVVNVRSDLTPSFISQRLKGRLSHSIRQRFPDAPRFQRAFFQRTLGANTKDVVKTYIRNQVDSSDLVDPLYRERLKELRLHQETDSVWSNHHKGTYDCLAHLVLVTGGRYRMHTPEAEKVFQSLRDGAADIDSELWEISIMPDHAHLLLRWRSDQSASELIEGLKKVSGTHLRRTAFWSGGGYVGSVGPYPLRTALERNQKVGWVREGVEKLKPLG